MTRINILIVSAAMLVTGLAMIVVLSHILPANADGQIPLELTGGGMLTVGFIAGGVVMRLTRRDS